MAMHPLDLPPSFERRPASPGKSHERVSFDLLQDDQGYPPANSETMWALPLGGSQFCLDNIPFFVCGVSFFDIIEARQDANGHFKYVGLLQAGGHSTLRVILCDQPADPRSLQERAQELCNKVRQIGCSSEISHIAGLISVDVPPDVALAEVRSILNLGQNQRLWDYEEATLAHSVQ
jgi:hypothetical protein